MINEFAVVREWKNEQGTTYLFVDTSKAVLRGMKWSQLGDWGKRKFENLLFLTTISKQYVKVHYI
jgi:predicted RNA-binding Zn ribbon-like protein